MGVKLSGLVIRKDIKIEELSNKKLAFDAFNVLYQFLSSIRQRDGSLLMDSKGNVTSHLMGLWTRFTNLMLKDIKIAVVFDGKPPELKFRTTELREEKKKIAEEKFKEAVEAEDVETAYKYSKQTIRLTKDMIDEAKELLSAMGLPVIQAPSEAEAQASYMCKKGNVWAVASNDFDCMLYGAPRVILNLTLSSTRRLASGQVIEIKPNLIDLKENLEHLKLNNEQLVVLAIIVGTDYNPGGVFRVGPKKAYDLVKKCKDKKDFNKLFEDLKPSFNWLEIYNTFKDMPITKDYKLKWEKPDVKRIKRILVDKHDFSEERVDSVIEKLEKIKETKKQSDLNRWF